MRKGGLWKILIRLVIQMIRIQGHGSHHLDIDKYQMARSVGLLSWVNNLRCDRKVTVILSSGQVV